VYDLHSVSTELGEVEFVTMEFIEGETLSDRIRRSGALSPGEAREIAVQVCAGLAQAHRQGVVHGDLKCSNIILAAGLEGRTRAVITDFGLATMKLPETNESIPGQQGGSFDYMAPELFSGAAVSALSDLYALGVVFHVMLTGKVPSPVKKVGLGEKGSTLTLGKAIPRRFLTRRCEKLPAPWGRLVARCLETAPEDRFSSAEEVMERLETPEGRQRMWFFAAPAAAAILALALWRGREQPGPPVRLAVLPVAVEGTSLPTAAGLGLELADRLSGARRGFVVIPPGEAQRNHVDTPERAKTVFSATHVLRTRLRNSAAQMIVEASVIDTGSGQALGNLRGVYALNDIALVAKALTATVTGAFRLRTGVPLEVVAVAAYPFYIQGLTLLRRDDVSADEAIPFFQKAIEIDPRSALPYAGLAEAQLQKFHRSYGHDWLDAAAQSIAKAESLNADSAPVLLASGLSKQQHGWYEQAARDFSRALELTPNNVEAWKRLADVYREMNRPDEAIATYQNAIRAEPAYYAPYYELGRFYHFRGELSQAEQLFRRVTAIAPGLGAGYTQLGVTLDEQGHFPEAEQALLTALRLQETSPVLTDLGTLYYHADRYGEAARYFERSLSLQPPTTVRYEDLGDAYRQLGRLEEAAAAYRRAQALAESDVIQNPREPLARANLARITAELGERSRAEFEIHQALTVAPENTMVMRLSVLTFEKLGERERALEVLARAPPQVLETLSRIRDLRNLQQDILEFLRSKGHH
jgi:tetratricopeptide (TPR) repeat protein